MSFCKCKLEMIDDGELCSYCPWERGNIEHEPHEECDDKYCDDAYDNYQFGE